MRKGQGGNHGAGTLGLKNAKDLEARRHPKEQAAENWGPAPPPTWGAGECAGRKESGHSEEDEREGVAG